MNNWFFSDKGKVTGPVDLAQAKVYLSINPNVYGWHPTFSQWKPVNCINEFYDILPPIEPSSTPKVIYDKFIVKQNRLTTKFSSITDSLKQSESSFNQLEVQIEAYKDLTKNLNDDVKGAINDVERKYNSIRRQLKQVRTAVSIARKEASVAVKDFERIMTLDDIAMPSCLHITSKNKVASVIKTLPASQEVEYLENFKASETKSVEKIEPVPAKLIEPESMETEQPQPQSKKMYRGVVVENIESAPSKTSKPEQVVTEKPQKMYRGVPVMKDDEHENTNKPQSKLQANSASQNLENSSESNSENNKANDNKESAYSIHSLMRSVFKGDSRFAN